MESFGVDKVFFIFDKYLVVNVGNKIDVEVFVWDGVCEVYECFIVEELWDYCKIELNVKIIVYLECLFEVVVEVDFVGLMVYMIDWVKIKWLEKVMMIIECFMVDNVVSEMLDVDFIWLCNLCLYMKWIMLMKILDFFLEMKEEVVVDFVIVEKVWIVVEWMINLKI